MNIRNKLYFGFSIVLAFTVIGQIVAQISLFNLSKAFNEFDAKTVRLLRVADNLRYYDKLLTDLVRTILIDPENKALYDQYKTAHDSFYQNYTEAKSLAKTEADLQTFAIIDKNTTLLDSVEADLMASPDIAKALVQYHGAYGQAEEEYAGQLSAFVQREERNYATEQDGIASEVSLVQSVGLILSIIIIAGSLGVALLLSRNISIPLTQLTQLAKGVGEGDLSQRTTINRKDEIGTLARIFNSMLDNLQATMASQVAKEYLEKVINQYRAVIAQISSGDLTARLELNGNGSHNQTGDDLYQLGINLNTMAEGLSSLASRSRESATWDPLESTCRHASLSIL